jgi:2-polyprenyl-3-methyl-5-hydroxy-6-metoxy-1,4-benzoquinol methylase/uncharacterized protein YbaR (Trm112 family)
LKEFTLDYIRCIKCNSKLELDAFKKHKEIEEGFLYCTNCECIYPIIERIPIIWNDFSSYLSNRRTLGGKLVNLVSPKMKSFLKKSLKKKIQHIEDRSILEQRWTNIYQKSARSKFYSIIKKRIKDISFSKFSLEYGCSIGTMSKVLAESSQNVFGVDRSFSAIQIAQKNSKDNLDYLVADSLSPLFGRMKFNLILALNLLELVEPMEFLEQIRNQISKGFLVITDPYDYDRGKNSVRKPLDEAALRKKLQNYGFQIIQGTDKPSNLTWNLKLNPRTTLHYKVDLVMAKK